MLIPHRTRTQLVPFNNDLCTTSLWCLPWPALPATRPPAAAARVLARCLCCLIARTDTPAALVILRDHEGPPSCLVLHAFLRATDAPHTALLLLTHTAKPTPRFHSLMLNPALNALLTQVSGGIQHKHNFAWSTPWPAVLMLSPELVFHPTLRLMTAFFVVACRLLVCRHADTVTHLWQTLLAQRDNGLSPKL
ncbi:hypothetical protein C8J57DRAFT_1540119 [Mycena rebaudengoi]|nr:hypothetical protein C8J57DRAFT_1540119 [Mycena rebaudengoi]